MGSGLSKEETEFQLSGILSKLYVLTERMSDSVVQLKVSPGSFSPEKLLNKIIPKNFSGLLGKNAKWRCLNTNKGQ